jgi:hypothetical protein
MIVETAPDATVVMVPNRPGRDWEHQAHAPQGRKPSKDALE